MGYKERLLMLSIGSILGTLFAYRQVVNGGLKFNDTTAIPLYLVGAVGGAVVMEGAYQLGTYCAEQNYSYTR